MIDVYEARKRFSQTGSWVEYFKKQRCIYTYIVIYDKMSKRLMSYCNSKLFLTALLYTI